MMQTHETLPQIANVLEKRKKSSSDTSYVAKLYEEGINKILEKVGEEATEVILAAKDYDFIRAAKGPNLIKNLTSEDAETIQKKEALVEETADLWFHSLVMLVYLDLRPEDVLKSLAKRFGTSGFEEKNARKSNND